MYKAQIRFTTPMLYAMGFIMLFTIGGLTGLFLGALAVDMQLHDTYFVIAHFHYVAMGSTLFAFLGGVYHWFPKITGKMYNERAGQIIAVIVFIGFNLTFFPLFIGGSRGAPRRWATYPPEYAIYHRLATCGAYVMTSGLIAAGVTWLQGARHGRKAPPNPWGGSTLEWHTASPPPHDNFPVAPTVGDPYDTHGWEYVSEEKGWVLKPDYEPAVHSGAH
jgi:cytochrome c oxidase subunit 1